MHVIISPYRRQRRVGAGVVRTWGGGACAALVLQTWSAVLRHNKPGGGGTCAALVPSIAICIHRYHSKRNGGGACAALVPSHTNILYHLLFLLF